MKIFNLCCAVSALFVSATLFAMGAEYTLDRGVRATNSNSTYTVDSEADIVLLPKSASETLFLVRTEGHFDHDLVRIVGGKLQLLPIPNGLKLLEMNNGTQKDITREYALLPTELNVAPGKESQIVAIGAEEFLASKDIGHAVFKTRHSGKKRIVALRFFPEPEIS
jgi:hypothetical protein